MTAAPRRDSWDLFCRVVDNFGDIGIAWRLAKQLAAGPTRSVRLFVDGFDAFARIEPRLEVGLDRQAIDRIDIVRWSRGEAVFDSVATVVVELLGCGLPPAYLEAMTRRPVPPVWIDFEHLSAEPWVADFHGLPSPHPRLPLVKHFFYPGFGPRTGGLPIERDFARRRATFLADGPAIAALWRRLGVSPPIAGELRMSLFAYPTAPIAALIAALRRQDRRWSILSPEGVAPRSGDVTTVPFVDQETYDRLLWACDVNFVRGEDSFVRAQAAGRPFVWQIYRQAEDAHLAKLQAFQAVFAAGMPARAAEVQRALSAAWNDPAGDPGPVLEPWLEAMPALRLHAERWCRRLVEDTPLIDRLLAFVAALRPPSNAADLLD